MLQFKQGPNFSQQRLILAAGCFTLVQKSSNHKGIMLKPPKWLAAALAITEEKKQ